MRLVGILALLSVAVFLCSWDGAATTGLILPSVVTINVKVYRGVVFEKSPSLLNAYILHTFTKAKAMLNKFQFGTTIKLNHVASTSFDDTMHHFVNFETVSQNSSTPDINLHVFFADHNEYKRKDIRNKKLLGKMCALEAKFRTLLLNRFRVDGWIDWKTQTSGRAAKILVYYIGMLLGMNRDSGNACPSGLMDYNNWDSGATKQTWNNCNAKDFQTFFMASPMYAREWRSTQSCIDRESKHYKTIPTKLRLSVLVVAEHGFNKDTAQSIIDLAQRIVRKKNYDGTYQLGMPIDLEPTFASLDTTLPSTFVEAIKKPFRYTTDKADDLFVFFTKSGVRKPAHDQLASNICSTDKHQRILILDQKVYVFAGTNYTMSNNALARQLAYFIASSLGIESDKNSYDFYSEICDDGFMKYKDESSYSGSDDDKLKNMLNYWNTNINTKWNNCNAEDLVKYMLLGNACLKAPRRNNN